MDHYLVAFRGARCWNIGTKPADIPILGEKDEK